MMNFSLNHVGIKVIDMPAMSDFYTSFFGFVITDRRDDPNPIQFMTRSPDEHHQLLLAWGREPDQPSTVAQISFLMDDFRQLRELHERAQADPRVTKIWTLDHGNSWTVYFHDPEGNTIECYVHTPWHVSQPYGTPIDFSLSDDEIYAQTEAASLANPTYMTAEAFHDQLVRQLAGEAA